MRTCMVKGRLCYFHGIFTKREILTPSPLQGGHNGGIIEKPVVYVEDVKEGTMTEVNPLEIKFVDNLENPDQWNKNDTLGKNAVIRKSGRYPWKSCNSNYQEDPRD